MSVDSQEISVVPACSIAICTSKSVADCRKTIDSVRRACDQLDGKTESELLVVLNRPSVGDQATHTAGGHLRVLHEPRRGKGFAYNAAIRAARSNTILWTDDDVIVPPTWVGDMCGPIWRDEADAVAGGVRIADSLCRAWMTRRHRQDLTSTADYGWTYEDGELIGANMAIRRDLLVRIGGFDPELGPGALGFKDETLVHLQIAAVGGRIVRQWDVEVEHFFDPSRLTRGELVKRAYAHGRSDAYVIYHWEHQSMKLPGLRRLLVSARWRLWRLMHPQETARGEGVNLREVELAYRVAYLEGMRREQFRPRNYARHGTRKLDGVLDPL